MTIASPTAAEPSGPFRPPYDLSLDINERVSLLEQTIESADWVNAALLAAGMSQVVADYLQPDPLHLGSAIHRILGGRPSPLQRAERVVELVSDLGRFRPRSRRITAWRRTLLDLERLLAGAVVDPESVDAAAVRVAYRALRAELGTLPAPVRERSARLPACFHSFDLDVPDVETLARRFAESYSDREMPILVVGIRTSGSYLAPLCAAYLTAAGFTRVAFSSIRPRRNITRSERQALRRHARQEGLVLLLDDPPGTGGAVAQAAHDLERVGVPARSIVLLLPLFGPPDSLPARLSAYSAVVLAAEDWAIESKLSPAAVQHTLETLMRPGTRIAEVVRLKATGDDGARGHRHGIYRVAVSDDHGRRDVEVYVKGVGVGYFGENAVALAHALAEYVPDLYGLHGGCLYRRWLPESKRAMPSGDVPPDAVLEHVSHYIAARRTLLAVARDRSGEMFGENPVWEAASNLFATAFGRFAPAARIVFLDRFTRDILQIRQPSIVDGATSLRNWFIDERLVKVNFATRSFSNRGYRTYDAVYDLAGATVTAPSRSAAAKLRSAYEALAGEPVDDERLLIYELVHLEAAAAKNDHAALDARRAQSRSLHRYMADLYLGDLESDRTGDLCSIDLDGVFETGLFGFLSTTATGATALRTLVAHGFRPVPVTGRSTQEVRDRCRAYRLQGGVAEYGAVVYLTDSGQCVELLDPDDRSVMRTVRSVLADSRDVDLDHGYERIARAFVHSGGRRRPLPAHVVDAIVDAAGGRTRVRVVPGWAQTDFVPAGIDKGRGVTELLKRLGGELALAVGDTGSDLPMLRLARLAVAPSNADAAVRSEGTEIVNAPYQAGLSLAVARLVGHHPGGCAICHQPKLTTNAELVARMLALQERTGSSRVGAAAAFAVAHARAVARRRQ